MELKDKRKVKRELLRGMKRARHNQAYRLAKLFRKAAYDLMWWDNLTYLGRGERIHNDIDKQF